MATHAKLIPGTPYGRAVRPEGMTTPVEQPQGEDAFGKAFADILNGRAKPKQYDKADKKHLLEAAKDKAVLSDVFDECWPRDTQTGTPYPVKKTTMLPIAAPPYIERICNATFNYRAGYTADNHIYAKETVLTAFREYTPPPSSQPHCDHPCWLC
eukprot:jgi/Tetstr1/446982/TSEL_034440.t1